MLPWEQWRPWMQRQRPLLRELVLMLVAMLVIGVYFLEHFSAGLAQERQLQLQALAEQTARRAAEALASDDAISVNLISRETLALDPVEGVRFATPAGETVSQTGSKQGELSVQVAVPLPDGELAGSLVLIGDQDLAPRQQLEAGYVLAVLCVLLLWLAVTVIRQRLFPATTTDTTDTPDSPPPDSGSMAPEPKPDSFAQPWPEPVVPSGPVRAQLRLSIVNFSRFRERYTATALDELLADYQRALSQVAALYGGVVDIQVGQQARLTFHGDSDSQAAFSGLCAGLLFLRVVRLWAPERKRHGQVPLEFKGLMTTAEEAQEAWALCVAGVPGRLQVPEPELTAMELDVKALYQPERAQTVKADDREIRLQPVEQLAHRYQSLLRRQADSVLASIMAAE